MVTINIEKKILDEQLALGKKVSIVCYTEFNGANIEKIFPDDFTPEQQLMFKDMYDLLAYEGEVSRKIFKCKNEGNVITISGYARTGVGVDDVEDFVQGEPFELSFTRFGITKKSVTIYTNYGTPLTQVQLDSLKEIGIEVTGFGDEFEIMDFDSDISIQLVTEYGDSYVDFGDFTRGQIIFKK